MMRVFDRVAKVKIDGSDILELLHSQSTVRVYKVRGLEPKIVVRDRRYKNAKNLTEPSLPDTALVTIHQLMNGSMLIDLEEPMHRLGDYTFCIDNGDEPDVGEEETLFDHFEFREDNGSLVVISVTKSKRTRHSAENWSFLSV